MYQLHNLDYGFDLCHSKRICTDGQCYAVSCGSSRHVSLSNTVPMMTSKVLSHWSKGNHQRWQALPIQLKRCALEWKICGNKPITAMNWVQFEKPEREIVLFADAEKERSLVLTFDLAEDWSQWIVARRRWQYLEIQYGRSCNRAKRQPLISIFIDNSDFWDLYQ